MEKFDKLPNIDKVDILLIALSVMQQYNGRTTEECIETAMEKYLNP